MPPQVHPHPPLLQSLPQPLPPMQRHPQTHQPLPLPPLPLCLTPTSPLTPLMQTHPTQTHLQTHLLQTHPTQKHLLQTHLLPTHLMQTHPFQTPQPRSPQTMFLPLAMPLSLTSLHLRHLNPALHLLPQTLAQRLRRFLSCSQVPPAPVSVPPGCHDSCQ